MYGRGVKRPKNENANILKFNANWYCVTGSNVYLYLQSNTDSVLALLKLCIIHILYRIIVLQCEGRLIHVVIT